MRTGLPAAVGLAKSRTGGNHRLGPRLNPACIFRPDRMRVSRDARTNMPSLTCREAFAAVGLIAAPSARAS
jgi:hypothetical protein